jgi:hypothetical protein
VHEILVFEFLYVIYAHRFSPCDVRRFHPFLSYYGVGLKARRNYSDVISGKFIVIDGISAAILNCFAVETLREVFLALVVLHSNYIGLQITARTMHHAFGYCFMQHWMIIWIWYFCIHKPIIVVRSSRFVLFIEDNQYVSVGKPAFLELDDIYVRHYNA